MHTYTIIRFYSNVCLRLPRCNQTSSHRSSNLPSDELYEKLAMKNYFAKPSLVVPSILIIFTGHVEARPVNNPAGGEARSGDFGNSSHDDTQRTKSSSRAPQKATNSNACTYPPSTERNPQIPETRSRTIRPFPFAAGEPGSASANQRLRIIDPTTEDVDNLSRHRRKFSNLPNFDMSKMMEPIESSSSSATKDDEESKSSAALRPLLKAESSRPAEEGQMSAPKLYCRKRILKSSSINERYRRLYEADGSWPEVRKMKELQVKQLNGYASVIHANALQVHWSVENADIIEGRLKLSDGGCLLKIDVLCFTTKGGDKMYVAKGMRRDSVYVLNADNDGDERIFTLREAVDVPRPVPPE